MWRAVLLAAALTACGDGGEAAYRKPLYEQCVTLRPSNNVVCYKK